MNDPFNIIIPLRLQDVDEIWRTLRAHRFEFADCVTYLALGI